MIGRRLTGFCVVALLAACTSEQRESICASPERPLPRVTMVPDVRPLPEEIIVTLRTRDHDVTVYTSEHGVRFSVRHAENHTIVATGLDERMFARDFPGLHRHFERAVADGGAGLWAGF